MNDCTRCESKNAVTTRFDDKYCVVCGCHDWSMIEVSPEQKLTPITADELRTHLAMRQMSTEPPMVSILNIMGIGYGRRTYAKLTGAGISYPQAAYVTGLRDEVFVDGEE